MSEIRYLRRGTAGEYLKTSYGFGSARSLAKLATMGGGALRSLLRTDWDGTDRRRTIYHHTRLVSDPNVSDKEARSAANCMVLHPACHDDPIEFHHLHGFFLDNLIRK